MEDSIKPTKEQIFLSIYKMAANNNAHLHLIIESLKEMRLMIQRIENEVINEEVLNLLLSDEGYISARAKIDKITEQLLLSEESKSMKTSFDWAFENDIDAIDLNGLI